VDVLFVLRFPAVIPVPSLHAFTLAAFAHAVVRAVVRAHLVLAGLAIEPRIAGTLAVVTDPVEATVERTRLQGAVWAFPSFIALADNAVEALALT